MELSKIVADFAGAFKAVDTSAPQGSFRERSYRPGIGPLTEERAIHLALGFLKQSDDCYAAAGPKRYPAGHRKCDCVIPGEWAIEFKLIRPFGDNGKEAEHWAQNILYPYPGSTSSIGDCFKLLSSGFSEKRAVIVFGFEHREPRLDLRPAIRAFEQIATHVCGINLGSRCYAEFLDLIHPYHQKGKVYGWEVLGTTSPKDA